MSKRMLIDAVRPEETRVVILGDNNRIEEFDFITSAKSQVKGNIYLAKITRVEPSLQAAFVEYGGDKQGFLSFSEIHPDYYQIPIADRKRLIEEMERQVQEDAEREARREREEESRGSNNEREDDTDTEGDFESDNGDNGGGRHRGRGRRRRRTYSSRAREEGTTPIVTRSEAIEEETTEPAQEGHNAAENDAQQQDALEASSSSTAKNTTEATDNTEESASPSAPIQETESESEWAEKPNTLDTNSDEDTIERARKTTFSKRYRIQEVIKRGQIVLVQVIKEERGNKGVSLTTYISLAGRYCVLMPNASKDGGISRKVGKNDERKRLREIASELKSSCGMSVIIRTAGLGRTKIEVKRDHEYLVKLWNKIREDALSSTAPALIYEESDILKRSIRDYYEPEIEEILVQGDDAFKGAKEFMKLIMPSHAPRVKLYKEETPILSDFRVESQLEEMYQPIAKLRSGGYIVINHTEALIAIDVNSGRSTSERNVEETALKTNLEAAREVARQLRLRDLGGLIVVDFIDMFYGKNRRAVERAFKDALRADRAKIQVGHISPFGLLELSRQRMRPSISETSTLPCPHCQGTGSIRSNDSMAIEIVRALEREASSGQFRELRVTVSTETALHMLNRTRHYLNDVEEKFNVDILIKADHAYLSSQYGMEKIRRPADELQQQRQEAERKAQQIVRQRQEPTEEHTPEEAEAASGEEETPRRRRTRGGRGRRRGNRDGEHSAAPAPREASTEQSEADIATPQTEAPVASPSPEPEATQEQEVKQDAPTDADTEEAAPKKPATRRKAATSRAKTPRAAASSSTTAKRTTRKAAPKKEPATKKTATENAGSEPKAEPAPEAPAAASRTAAARPEAKTAPAAPEPDPARPARKGWWSKVMS